MMLYVMFCVLACDLFNVCVLVCGIVWCVCICVWLWSLCFAYVFVCCLLRLCDAVWNVVVGMVFVFVMYVCVFCV